MSDVPNESNGMTMLKGLGLVIGGFALGFFGCLGGLSIDSAAIVGFAVVAGTVVMVIGGRWMTRGFVRVLMGWVKPSPKDQ